MHQEEQHKGGEQIKSFTTALMQAMGMSSDASSPDNLSPSAMFLTKLFKKNISGGIRKINEIRFNRLNGYFYYFCQNMPTDKITVDITCQIIIAFLNNENIQKFETSTTTSITCGWIARTLERLANHQHESSIIPILQLLITNKKITSLTVQNFQELIRQSEYIKKMQIKKEEETKANQSFEEPSNFLFQMNIQEQILSKLRPENLFRKMFISQNKMETMKLYLNFLRATDNFNLDVFKKTFFDQESFTKEIIEAILYALDSEFFDLESFDELSKVLFTQARIKNNGKFLFSGCIKGLKNEGRLIEILNEIQNTASVDELAQAFINEKQINNFYLLFLINKSSETLSEKYVLAPFLEKQGEDSKTISNREAIIASLAVINFPDSYNLLLDFALQYNTTNQKKKICLIKLLIFSFFKIPRSHLLTKIMKTITSTALDDESEMNFLPSGGIGNILTSTKGVSSSYESLSLNKIQKQKVQKLTQMQLGSSTQIFKLKLELHWQAGTNIKYMSDLQQLNKFFEEAPESSPQQILQKLKSIPESLLEIALMAINNKIEEEFMINFTNSGELSQWLLNLQKKQMKKLKSALDAAVSRPGYSGCGLEDLIMQIFEFNVQKHFFELSGELTFAREKNKKYEIEDLTLDEKFRHFTDVKSMKRLNDLNFSEYLLNQQSQKKPHYEKVDRPKSLIIELRKLVKYISQNKRSSKKDAKIILSEANVFIRACRIVFFLSKSKCELIIKDNLKKLVKSAMSYFSPEFQFFEDMERRATSLQIAYFSMYDTFPYILSVNYEESAQFLSKLLSSKIPQANEQKEKKKKMKRKNETNVVSNQQDKLINVLLENLCCVFGDPNQLLSFRSILQIINHLAKRCSREELGKQIVRWISLMKIFHCETSEEWLKRTFNFINLWDFINPLILENISHEEIERHFLIMIDLLNTLYEKYRKEQKFIELERELLKGLYSVYRLDCQKNSLNVMEQQERERIPYDKLDQSLVFCHPKMVNDPQIYYCYNCQKNICQICANLIHKAHDKVFKKMGSETDCPHSQKKDGNQRKKNRERAMLNELQEIRDRERDREMRKEEEFKYIFMSKIGNRDGELPPPQIFNHHLRKQRIQRLQLQRMSRQNRQILLNPDEGEQQQEQKKDDPNEIKGCEQKQYLIQEIEGSEFLDIYPVFTHTDFLKIQRKSKINLAPLFNLFIRQIKNGSFLTSENTESDPKKAVDDSGIKAQVSVEKYLLFKSDLFKHNGMAIPNRSPYMSSSQALSISNRNTIALNDRLIAIVAGPANLILSFQFQNIKGRFLKRQTDKRYRDPESIEPLMHTKSKANQPVIQLCFCPTHRQMLAVVSQNRVTFEHYTVENRVQKITTADLSYAGQISKFQWVRGGLKDKFYFTFLTREIHLGKLVRNQQPERKAKVVVRNRIRDYGLYVTHSTKALIITLIDTEGKLFRGNIDTNSNSTVDFNDKLININYNKDDPLFRICCFAYFVVCSTVRGNLIILNFDEENNLIGQPTFVNVIDKIKVHHVAEQYRKISEFTKITEMRAITRSQSELFMSCLLTKDYPPSDTKRLSNFAIIAYNFRKKTSHIQIYNDNSTTISYDFTPYSDKDFLILCNQDEGEIWGCRFSPSKSLKNDNQFKITLSVSKMGEFSEICQKNKILNEIKFYDTTKYKSNKAHNQISSNFKITFDDVTLKYEPIDKDKFANFVTMVSFELNSNKKDEKTHLVINFMNKNYQYILDGTNNYRREVQFPLSIKETLDVYMGTQNLQITFLEVDDVNNQSKKFTLENKAIHGIRSDEKSPQLDALVNLTKILSIYLKYPQQSVQHYFYNENRCAIGDHKFEDIQKLLNKRKYTRSQGNLLLKLEMLRQSLDSHQLNEFNTQEIFESIRKQILKNAEKSQIKLSIKKLLRKLNFQSSNTGLEEKWPLGHPNNDRTLIDIYETFQLYQNFKLEQTTMSYERLQKKMILMLNSRTINCFIIMKIYPQIKNEIANFYHKIITDFRHDFRMTENGLDSDDKEKLINMCENVVRILSEEYQLSVNTNLYNKRNNRMEECALSPERNLLNTLESIFCIHKKDVYREVDINPFPFMKPVFALGERQYENVAINYLTLQKLQISDSLPQIQASKNSDPLIEEPNVPAVVPDPSREPMTLEKIEKLAEDIMYDGESGESDEQMKEAEQQNREMQQQYYMSLQKEPGEGNQGLDGIIDEEYQQLQQNNEQDAQQANKYYELMNGGSDLINIERIYQYLGSKNLKDREKIMFRYEGLCENLLIEVFTRTDHYLTLDNSVFYVGLVYQLLLMVESKLRNLFGDFVEQAFFENQYTKTYVKKIIEAIDQAITSDHVSILFMAVNNFLEITYKRQGVNYIPVANKTLISNLFMKFYRKNPNSTAQMLFRSPQHEFWLPKKTAPLAPLSSVIKFEYFDIENRFYQILFMGNIYQNLDTLNHTQQIPEFALKEITLRIVIRYNLRVFRNIMLLKKWDNEIPKIKLRVGFEDISAGYEERGLKTIVDIVVPKKETEKKEEVAAENSEVLSMEMRNKREERIEMLEELLGQGKVLDEQVLTVLNQYYNEQ